MSFFTLMINGTILNTRGLQAIDVRLADERIPKKARMHFIYHGTTMEIKFDNDEQMFEYHESLMKWLTCKIVK